MNFSTPALLFGSIDLVYLVYTHRFIRISKLIREMCDNNKDYGVDSLRFLRKRIRLIRIMQVLGLLSFSLCACSLLALFLKIQLVGKFFFILSFLLLLSSLFFIFWELIISTKLLDNMLSEEQENK